MPVSCLHNQEYNLRDVFNKFTINKYYHYYCEELHSLYLSPNIVRRRRWAGHVARREEGRCAFQILTGKRTGKRPLGRPRHRWEDNIRMDLKEIGINTRNC